MILKNVKVSFVKFDDPEENMNGKLSYGCCVLIDKDDKANLAALEKEIERATIKGVADKWAGKKPAKFAYKPLRDGDEEIALYKETDGDEGREGAEYKNHLFINPSMLASYGKPGLVDANLNPVMEKGLFYSGCIVNIDVSAFPYMYQKNKGIGWGFNNVMFVKDSDRLDGRQSAENAFEGLGNGNGEGKDEKDAF